jgi:hypothetical protein
MSIFDFFKKGKTRDTVLPAKQPVEPDYGFLSSIEKKKVENLDQHSEQAKLIKWHMSNGYIQYSTVEFTLQCVTIPSLKQVLSSKGIKLTGKKDELIERILFNFSEEEIRSIITDSFYQRTSKGNTAVEKWLKKKQTEHLSEIKKIADMIQNQQFEDAILEIRPSDKNIIYSSSDSMINAIPLYMKDIGTTEQRILYTAVDCVLLQSNYGYVNMVIGDLHDLGYEVSKEDVLHAANGCHAYCDLINIKEAFPEDKYYFISGVHDSLTCERCRPLDGKKFAIKDAKIGKTLPPFCDDCRCIIQAESVHNMISKNKS